MSKPVNFLEGTNMTAKTCHDCYGKLYENFKIFRFKSYWRKYEGLRKISFSHFTFWIKNYAYQGDKTMIVFKYNFSINKIHGVSTQQKGGIQLTTMYIAVDSKRKSAILQIFSPKDNLRTTIRHHHFIILLYTSILVPSSWKRITVQDLSWTFWLI